MWVWLQHKQMPKGDDTNTDSTTFFVNFSLVPSRPWRFRMWRHLSSLSGKFAIALGSKPPLVTRIARTGLGRRLCKFLYAQPKADTWMGKYSGPRYNEILGLANDFLYPVIVKYMEKNLDITKAPQSEQILPVPWHFVISRFHWIVTFRPLHPKWNQLKSAICTPKQEGERPYYFPGIKWLIVYLRGEYLEN